MEYKESELSQWFDLNVQKPWQEGVYEVLWPQRDSAIQKFKPAIAYWNGDFFGQTGETLSYVTSHRRPEIHVVITKWRGLSSAPSPKPKRKGNPRVTRYVVRSADKMKVFASFDDVDNARLYADNIKEPVRITKIRFRTPEAKK